MTTIDPTTSRPLPADAIQRILHISPKVHVFQIPPLTSTKGHTAAQWTVNPPIFTARIRVFETTSPSSSAPRPNASKLQQEPITVAILLEDPRTGELFAAAPYNHPSSVEQCVDSSRFFAMRVVGEGGMKAMLGIGFEERSEAFDFGISLQDAAKVLNLTKPQEAGSTGRGGQLGRSAPAQKVEEKRDYSLKEGEMITVNIGAKGAKSTSQISTGGKATAMPFLPPPPSAHDVKRSMQDGHDEAATHTQTAAELGFDDGEFGEFQ